MSDPREPLADPARERLAADADLAVSDRPPAEFSPSTLIIIYGACITGVALLIAGVWWAVGWWLR